MYKMRRVNELVEVNFRIGFTNKESLSRSAYKCSEVILKSWKQHLFRGINHTGLDEAVPFVQAETAANEG